MITVEAKALAVAVKAVLPAANDEPGRYDIDCIHLHVVGKNVHAEATDGKHLMISRAPVLGGEATARADGALVERRAARKLCKALLGLKNARVDLDVAVGRTLRWRADGRKTWLKVPIPSPCNGEDRLLRFPDVQAMLPTGKAAGVMTTTVGELRETSRLARICSAKGSLALTFELGGAVRARSRCSEVEFEREMEAAYAGPDRKLSYNPRCIEDALVPLKGGGRESTRMINVCFFGKGATALLLIIEPEVTCLIAPIRVRQDGRI